MKILFLEEDAWLGAELPPVLADQGFMPAVTKAGPMGIDLAIVGDYDLILLAVHGTLDGIDNCRQLRSRGYRQPILLLTSVDTDTDTDAVAIAGFAAGANDCIQYPCAPEVLGARIRTLLRRHGAISGTGTQDAAAPLSAEPATGRTLTWGDLCLELQSGWVTCSGEVIALTATEYNLLALFLSHPNRIFSRSAILDRLWGLADAPSDRAIVTHMKELRRKLKAGGLTEDLIETIYGMGYRLRPAPSSSSRHRLSRADRVTSTQAAIGQIEQVLERFRSVFDGQVALLGETQAALQAGDLDPAQQQAARQVAHKLAGTLATFGYPTGSTLARSIEHLLLGDGDFSPADRSKFAELVTALQQEWAQPPVRSPSPEPDPETGVGPRAALGGSVPTHRVLVIDDDAALTERLQAEAEAWGLRMQVAPDPTAARSLLMSSSPEVVLLDLSFPATEEDGLSLLQEMSARSPTLPVIVFTGRDSLADRLAVSRLGARQFLQKPATPAQIFQAIARVLPPGQTAEAKVLIVDDDSGMLALLSALLTPWGLDVVTLSEPQNFWTVLVATSPHLILLDLEMPQVSGLELCQVVRQDATWGNLPILVVTAQTDAAALQQAFAAGADDFITKPVLGPELISRVLSRIDRHLIAATFKSQRVTLLYDGD